MPSTEFAIQYRHMPAGMAKPIHRDMMGPVKIRERFILGAG